MSSIYDLSWSKTSFFAKLQLFFKSQARENQKIKSDDPLLQADGYSALSSTYYSILGTAFSQLKATLRPKWLAWFAPVRIIAWCLTWLPLTAWCYWRMLPLSNRVVEIIGYDGMSADQCDVRQSILRRCGKYDEARKCIIAALAKNPEKAHTRGLLHVGLADVYRHEGSQSEAAAEIWLAIRAAVETEMQDPRQASRIYRNCADIADLVGGCAANGRQFRQKAKVCAEAASAEDQILKIYN